MSPVDVLPTTLFSVPEASLPQSFQESWILRGSFEGPRSGRRTFTATVVLNQESTAATSGGVAVLLSAVEAETGRQAGSSLLHPRLLEGMVQRGFKVFRGLNVDKDLLHVCLQELRDSGPPMPVVLRTDPIVLQAHSFSLRWGDFSLAQSAGSYLLTFVDPLSGKPCRFQLHSEAKPVTLPLIQGLLSCDIHPRLTLSGFMEEEAVVGEAWLERRLGQTDWLSPPAQKTRILATDSFGFRLEDGSDWMILRQRDAESGEQVEARVVVREATGRIRSSTALLAKPLRHWVSSTSSVGYPVAWKFAIPAWEAELTFEPATDGQEIALAGPARGLWHGTGQVQGSVREQSVYGFASAELHGYGLIFSFQALLDHMAAMVDHHIESFLPRKMDAKTLEGFVGAPHWLHAPEAYSESICQPVWDLIARKGKRWRPAFGILLLEALGTPSEPYRDLMCVFPELGHTGSLIIDDIEDDSLIRRGDECIHRRYGTDVALNAGNTLYFLPTLLLSRHPRLNDKQRLEIHEIINRLFVQAHFGQGLDIYWSRHITRERLREWVDEELGAKILQMYAYKTAAFVECFAEIAAVIAGAPERTRQACIEFSRTFGVAFQILDDVRNFATSPHWTKVPGEDIEAGKLTYVVARAMSRLPARDQERLATILCTRELRETLTVRTEAIALVRQSGVLEACTEEARAMTEAAWGLLGKCLPPSMPRMLLRLLCQKMLALPYDP